MKMFLFFVIVVAIVFLFFSSLFAFTVFADTTGTLRPTADGGNDSADWTNTGSTACNTADCYLEVDESSGAECTNSDGDTSYITTNTNNANQTFDIDESSIPNGSIITQIDITVCATRQQGGVSIQTRRCVDASCSNFGVDISPPVSYGESTQSHTGLNITKEASTDIEIGIANTATKTGRLSQISAIITYTPPDTTAPSAVSDLSSSSVGNTNVNLSWTAPGDDAGSGTATTYDIRYSTSVINDSNWSSTTLTTGEPSPSIAGTSESFNVTGLSASTLYYFGIKTSDEVPNESGLSNIYSTTTTSVADTTAPSAVSDLATSGATTNSINLNWTAPGDDAGSGTATTYDIRYSTSVINDSNWSSATLTTGEPSPSVASSSENMTVSGLSARTTYFFAIKTSDEVPNESAISNVPSLATKDEAIFIIPSAGSSGGVAPSRISFSGQAYPNSKIEVLRKGSLDTIYRNIPITQSSIDDNGIFSISYLGLLGADYFIALRVEDSDGRKTGIISFNVDLATEDLIVTNIFVPPTVGFENSVVKKGADVHIIGYAAPNNIVELEISGIEKETTANADGLYEFVMDTDNLNIGNHIVRARQIASSMEEIRTSSFSISRTFRLSSLNVPLADFNNDSEIGITDWSIFLFRWGSKEIDTRLKIDLDANGIINITDLSIFLRAFNI